MYDAVLEMILKTDKEKVKNKLINSMTKEEFEDFIDELDMLYDERYNTSCTEEERSISKWTLCERVH